MKSWLAARYNELKGLCWDPEFVISKIHYAESSYHRKIIIPRVRNIENSLCREFVISKIHYAKSLFVSKTRRWNFTPTSNSPLWSFVWTKFRHCHVVRTNRDRNSDQVVKDRTNQNRIKSGLLWLPLSTKMKNWNNRFWNQSEKFMKIYNPGHKSWHFLKSLLIMTSLSTPF